MVEMNKKVNKIIAVVLSLTLINGIYKHTKNSEEARMFRKPFELEEEIIEEDIDGQNNVKSFSNTRKRKRMYYRSEYKETMEKF